MSNIKETIGQFFHTYDDNIFSQKFLRNTIYNFRIAGTRHSGFNSLDEPGAFFFRPVFYFTGLESQIDDSPGTGLLYPSWNHEFEKNTAEEEKLKDTQSRFYDDAGIENSAYNYLMRNDEEDRAKLLKLFVETLSSICVKSPWYFQSVSGLDSATEKKFFSEPKVDESKRQIKFELLPDAYDTRIGTMLDAYRSACFSWQSKREIVPANLRKFDMGLYLYLKPVQSKKGPLIPLGEYDVDINVASHKYFEFHNCEISFESFKFGDAFSNVDASGTPMKYSLVINYDECFEDRLNDQFVGIIGDCIVHDMIDTGNDHLNDARGISGNYLDPLNTPHGMDDMWTKSKFLNNALKNVYSATTDRGVDYLQAKATTLALGNIYGLQATNLAKRVMDGQFFGLGRPNYKPDNTPPTGTLPHGDMYKPDAEIGQKKMVGDFRNEATPVTKDIYPEVEKVREVRELGNLYAARSVVRGL